MNRLTIMGGGAFGTALAIALSANEPVHLWMRRPEPTRSSGKNPRLPGVTLRSNITVSDVLGTPETVLLAVPMQQLSHLCNAHPALANATLVACCKGMEIASGLGPTGVIAKNFPHSTTAILTGPSFAADIARGLPTALTLACTDETHGAKLQEWLSTPRLRLYLSTDISGAELGGALKNVIAIASGVAIGAGLGDSARAAVMTRGFAEMTRFACALGAQAETLSGLSGFGDLALTCTSPQSRNFRYGVTLGAGTAFDTTTTIEGAATARAVATRAKGLAIDMPITDVVADLVTGTLTAAQALDRLLNRPLKKE
jgi:glycerol-3-phosphate dehydrogenase (NAD(P)+)